MTAWNETAWFSIFMSLALKSTAALGTAWLAAFLLRGKSAAVRHLVWTGAAAAVVALPLLSVSMPAWPVRGASALLANANLVFQTTATTQRESASAVEAQRTTVGETAPGRAWTPDWRL